MRSVVVTGTSTGIGRTSALRLDAAGWRVFAGIRREEDARALREVASERLVPVMLDVTDASQVAAATELIGEMVGSAGLDGLVNNAGITIPCPLEVLPIEDLRRLFEVNLIGPAAVTQALLPQLREASGRVVFVSSLSGRMAMPLLGAYGASKSALEAVAEGFRRELRPWRISVSVIEPGRIETPIWERGEDEIEMIVERSLPEATRLYSEAIGTFRRIIKWMRFGRVPPEKVASSIEHALFAPHPRLRYMIGAEVRGQAIAHRLLPDRVIDSLVAGMMRL